jgi:hypothetical protein
MGTGTQCDDEIMELMNFMTYICYQDSSVACRWSGELVFGRRRELSHSPFRQADPQPVRRLDVNFAVFIGAS